MNTIKQYNNTLRSKSVAVPILICFIVVIQNNKEAFFPYKDSNYFIIIVVFSITVTILQ